MDVRVGNGIGNLVFGMSEANIVLLLGKPNRIVIQDENEYSDDPQKLLTYNNNKLRPTLYKDKHKADRLGRICRANSNVTYKGKEILGLPISEAINSVFETYFDNWEIEHYDFFDTYFRESQWIELRVKYDTIVEIELGILYTGKNKDEYDWPILCP